VSRRLLASSTVALAALAFAACGDDEDDEVSGPATFAPADTAMYLEVSRGSDEQVANAEALIEEVGEVPLLGSVVDPGDLIEQGIDDAAAEEGLDFSFAEDVEPWLGDSAGIAFTGSVGDLVDPEASDVVTPDETQGFVAAVETTDEEAARDAIEKVLPEDEATTVTDGFLVLGSTDGALEAGLDARESGSLADTDEFGAAVDELADERLALGYLDVGAILDAGVEDGEIDQAEFEAINGLYGDGLDQPLAFTLGAGDRTVSLDASGAEAVTSSPPALGPTDQLAAAPGNAFAAIGSVDVGGQVQRFVDFLEANSDLFGDGELEPGAVAERFEREIGVPLDDVTAAAGDAAVHIRGELPDRFVIGAELAVSDDGLPSQFYDFVAEELRRDGFRTGPPLDGSSTGFSAERPDTPAGELGFVNVATESESVLVTLAPSREVAAETPAEGALGDEEVFATAQDALGEDFDISGLADLGPILDAFVGDSSLLDLATGTASTDEAIAGFLADKLGYAAVGVRGDGDEVVQRLVLGLE
jgi:hypothetical protein